MKIVQIAVMPDSNYIHAALWALTDEGELYFLLIKEGKWAKQSLPTEKAPKEQSEPAA